VARTSLDSLLHYLRRLGPEGTDTAEDGDPQLLRRFATGGEEAAFTALVRRHAAMVWSVCSRLLPQVPDAEDAFQATFLVLVRKAGAIRKPELLGPWLYGVAWRVADKLRRAAGRRRGRERELGNPPAPDSTSDVVWRDLRPLLDEEVGRLPEKYRTPFVLCYLEGLTNEEAASRLRCPKGTVQSRLSRARERLRGRLVRRGVDLTGAALAVALAGNATSAAPAALITDTVRRGLIFAAGPAAQAGSAGVLAEGELHIMFMTKVKMAVLVLLASGVLGSGAALLGHRTPAGAPAPEQPKAAVAKTPPAAPANAAVAPAPPKPLPPKPPPALPPAKASAAAHDSLNRVVFFDGFDDPKTMLIEALDAFARRYNLTFDVNVKAFAADNVMDVLKFEIAQPNPVPPLNAPLQVVLDKILARLPSESGAVVRIRKGLLEITTRKAVKAELGIPENRPLLSLVYEDFVDEPLGAALEALASDSGFSIVLDRKAAGDNAAKATVTAGLHNVPVDTAVEVLAELADLAVARRDNVFYVTAREKAARFRAEQPPCIPGQPPAPPPAPRPRTEPGPKENAKPAR
jgi:RNA polymerase sigma factor (sigma-70 family)